MNLFRASALLIFIPIALSLTQKMSIAIRNSLLFMPNEFKILKGTFQELASANDFGKDPIKMTIVPGHTASYRGTDLGRCSREKHSCSFYTDLNPFKKYKDPDIQEILRQAYLNGGYQGWIDMNGLISITRSSFFMSRYARHELACVLGHELGHLFSQKPFTQRLALWSIEPTAEESELELIDAEVRREAEVQADIDASMMLFRAGYPMRTCLDFREKLLNSRWYQIPTDPEGHYPGLGEWLDRLSKFNDENKSLERPTGLIGTKGRWEFDRSLNVLSFIPN